MKKVAIIGLDTSHAVALPKLMQDPETPAEYRVSELHATRCLRFETPFQGKEGLDERQKYLESIGVQVTLDFDEAVADCDAILMEINDPAYHLEYFEKCAKLGKPIFLDKPFADNLANTRKIMEIAKANNVRFFTSSSLRFDVDFQEGLADNMPVLTSHVWGPVGNAPAGSSIVWYGVHAFEMMERLMGYGAKSIAGTKDDKGYVFHVDFGDGRRSIVELTIGLYRYGALLRNDKDTRLIQVTGRIPFYQMLLNEIVKFFDGAMPVPLEDSFEVMALLEAAQKSIDTGKPVMIEKI